MTKKEVSMSELFFDLVFVYVLSTINHTVEHISSNLVSLESLGKTFMLFLVFFAIWTYRTFLVNRFFKKKWYQYIFVFTDMFLILLLSKSINSNFQETFTPFVVITAIIFMSILLQYIINFTLHREAGTLKLVLTYTAGLFTAIIFSIISIFLSPNINFWIYFTGILILAFLPGILYKISKEKPVYFDMLPVK
ncbi:low temperature requirement protein A, partial [Mammaliicoccus lentus]|uniref:low temperature requirement protein A n=1 Tax=Mammaliicoccus lentus TaxID=42858 RepID=UPI00037E2853